MISIDVGFFLPPFLIAAKSFDFRKRLPMIPDYGYMGSQLYFSSDFHLNDEK